MDATPAETAVTIHSECVQRPAADLVPDVLLPEVPRPTPQRAPLWQETYFVPGSLGFAVPFWKNEILRDRPTVDGEILWGWLRGVSVHAFWNKNAQGALQGCEYKGASLPPVELPNQVKATHTEWVDSDISKVVDRGCSAHWSEVAYLSVHPNPQIVLPLGEEPKKPRLFWEGGWLNLKCNYTPFAMDGVGNVAQCPWKEGRQATLDHKSGFHHVPLAVESWIHFGLCWGGV